MTAVAAVAFAIGLILAQPAQARGDTVSDEEGGMVCDDGTLAATSTSTSVCTSVTAGTG